MNERIGRGGQSSEIPKRLEFTWKIHKQGEGVSLLPHTLGGGPNLKGVLVKLFSSLLSQLGTNFKASKHQTLVKSVFNSPNIHHVMQICLFVFI